MNTNSILIRRAALMLGLIVLIFSCQKINPFENVELIVSADIYKAPVLVSALNADPTSTVQPTDATISISGPNADLVVDELGSSDIKMNGGISSFNLLAKSSPSESNPIIINIKVACKGFISSNQTIRLTDPNTPLKVMIPLVSITAPPTGVSVVEKTVGTTNGQANAITEIVAEKTSSKTEKATISIPAGTQMQDANGKAINASSVSVTMAHFGTTTPQSIQAFPGGFIAENAITADGKKQAVTFETAGFVAIDMVAGGTNVKNFSTPIDVSIGVNSTLVNPKTGIIIKENDTVPVWSLDTETGQWKEEGIAIIQKDASGNLQATFKAKHLSWWNLDWTWIYGASDCTNKTLKINVTSNLSQEQAISPYEVQIQTASGQYLAGLHSQEMYNGLSLLIPRMPSVSQAKIVVMKGSKVVGSTALFNPCSIGTVAVNVTDTPPPAPITVNVDFTAKCTNKTLNLKPAAWIYLYDPTGDWYDSFIYNYMVNGKTSFRVKEGVKYYVYAYFGGSGYGGVITFNKTTSNLGTLALSNGSLTGTATYSATTNQVNLAAVFSSKCN